mgnify:CR=1 FL=1
MKTKSFVSIVSKTIRIIGITSILFQIIIYIGNQPTGIVAVGGLIERYKFENIPKLEFYITSPLATILAGIINLDSIQFGWGLGRLIGAHAFLILGLILTYHNRIGKSIINLSKRTKLLIKRK